MIRRIRTNKYHARKVEVDGYVFDSQAEYRYYMQKVKNKGVDIRLHEPFVIVDKYKLGKKNHRHRVYTPDFVFRNENGDITKVVDIKGGKMTTDASLRMAMFEKRYGIPVIIARYDNRSGMFFEKEF